MFVFRKISRALFSCYLRFEVRAFALLPTTSLLYFAVSFNIYCRVSVRTCVQWNHKRIQNLITPWNWNWNALLHVRYEQNR